MPEGDSFFGSVSDPLDRLNMCLNMSLQITTDQVTDTGKKILLWADTLLFMYREMHSPLKDNKNDLIIVDAKLSEIIQIHDEVTRTPQGTHDNNTALMVLNSKLHEFELLLRNYAYKYQMLLPTKSKNNGTILRW